MTDELLLKAKAAQKNICDIQNVLYAIEKIKLTNNNHKPYLRFVNALKWKSGKKVREGVAILFDGVSVHGTEIPVDKEILDCLKEYYRKKLKEAKTEFETL